MINFRVIQDIPGHLYSMLMPEWKIHPTASILYVGMFQKLRSTDNKIV